MEVTNICFPVVLFHANKSFYYCDEIYLADLINFYNLFMEPTRNEQQV